MEKQHKYTHLIFGISVFLFFTNCSNEFLDENPKATITSSNYYQTEGDAVAATNAIYDYLTVGTDPIFDPRFGGIFFNNYWVFKDLLSDNAFEAGSGAEYSSLSQFKFNSDNPQIEYYWQDLYRTIFSANVVIGRVPQINMDEMKRDHLVSEARFIRAMMYFEGVRLFGGVPLILNEITNVDDAAIARNTPEEVYQAIIDDLEYSRDHLSNSYRVGEGRATPLACSSLLAKVYLEMGSYDLAAQQAKAVIDSGEYELWQDYADIFKLDNANEKEVIFAANFSGTQSQGFKPNQYHVRLLPSGLDQNGEGPRNGFGLERPTDNLFNSYNPLDRRKSATFITSFTYSDNTTVNFDPHFGKFWDQVAEPRGNNTDVDVIYLRYADVLLIYAEALNELNGTPNSEAYWAINEIRKRARFNGTTSLLILPDLSGLSYDEFRNAILLERRWEFAMEGQRFHDLVRFGKLIDKVTGKDNATPNSFHELLPIPQRERNLNSNLTQNNGY